MLSDIKNESYISQKRVYDCFEDEYTFDAKGINVDFIRVIAQEKNIILKDIPIDNSFEDVFNRITDFYKRNKFLEKPLEVINYIKRESIVETAEALANTSKETHFNYCVKFSDRHQPEIRVSIDTVIKSIEKLVSLLKSNIENKYVYSLSRRYLPKPDEKDYADRGAYKKALLDYPILLVAHSKELGKEAIVNLNQDLCVYIVLWIHAYRFKQAITSISKDKSNILFSHRFKGWSQPGYKLNPELKLRFLTNFGFGKASYFRLMVIYRNVELINYIEWIDYRVKGVSVVKSCTRRYEGSKKGAGENNSYINNNNWKDAIDEVYSICTTYLDNEDEFVNKFIFQSLDKMVKELDTLFEVSITDPGVDTKHKLFKDTFQSLEHKEKHITADVKRVLAMSVKGEKITGSLEFISNIMQLKEFFSVEEYIERIKSLNEKLLPMMNNELDLIPNLKHDYKNSLASLYEKLKVLNATLEKEKYEERRIRTSKEREEILELIFENKNTTEIIKKCERDIRHYKKVIESFKKKVD